MNNPLWQNFRMERPANIDEGEQILFCGDYHIVKRIFDFGDNLFGIVLKGDRELIPMVVEWNEYQQVYDAG